MPKTAYKKSLAIKLDLEIHKKIRHFCIENQITIQDLITSIIEKHFNDIKTKTH